MPGAGEYHIFVESNIEKVEHCKVERCKVERCKVERCKVERCKVERCKVERCKVCSRNQVVCKLRETVYVEKIVCRGVVRKMCSKNQVQRSFEKKFV